MENELKEAQARIATLIESMQMDAKTVKAKDARIAELELSVFQLNNSVTSHHWENHSLRAELAALKAHEPVIDEQAAFEDWISRVCPSGDCSSVTEQWLASSDYADLYAAPVVSAEQQGVTDSVLVEALEAMLEECDPMKLNCGEPWCRARAAIAAAKAVKP